MKNFYKTLIFTIFFLSFMLNFKVFATEEETIILPNISYQSYNEYDDEEYYDEGEYYDEEDEEDEEEYTFDIVNKKFKKKILSKSKDFSVEYTGLEEGKTNIHPIQVDKKGTYLFEFGKDTYGSFTILIEDANGNDICYEEKELQFKKWTINLKLDVGKYFIKILSRECIDLDYSLYARHSKMKKTINLKMTSCDTRKLEPGFGKGTWKTSDKNIVLITNKKDLASVGNIRAKKTGTATITYTAKNGVIIKYKIKVTAGKFYPLDQAYFTMNSIGGLEPHILISNNSNKKIKYVYLTVSFYNAVGDKVTNDIGRNKSVQLKITGPIKPWKFKWYSWDPVFYNYSAYKMKIEKVRIDYFKGEDKVIQVNKKYKLK